MGVGGRESCNVDVGAMWVWGRESCIVGVGARGERCGREGVISWEEGRRCRSDIKRTLVIKGSWTAYTLYLRSIYENDILCRDLSFLLIPSDEKQNMLQPLNI